MSFATPDKLVMVSLLITREAVALQLFGPRGIWMSQRCPRHHHHLVNAPSPLLGRSARLASPVLGVRVSTARHGKGREGKGRRAAAAAAVARRAARGLDFSLPHPISLRR